MQAAARPKVMAGVALAGASMIAVTPIAPPPDLHVSSAAVRLTTGGDVLSTLTGDLTNLFSSDPAGGISSLFDFGGTGSSLLNIPYNIFADIVNIPFYESQALQEYAYALGPAGSTGGVAGWIPPGATVLNGGVNAATDQYALGGTGSWWMESLGNTWGWDNGNWPQLDAISHFLLPFAFTEPIAEQLQGVAQAEFIDGAHLGCQFECANPLGYFLGWLHGDVPFLSLLSGTTLPNELEDSVGSTGVTNPLLGSLFGITSPNAGGTVTPGDTIWSGSHEHLSLGAILGALPGNLMASPSTDPIQLPNFADVFTNFLTLGKDEIANFSPFEPGSFLYWGAPTDYSVPAGIGGVIQDLTGIPNQFGLANYGAEPSTAYNSFLGDLPGGFAKGLEYFINGTGGGTDSHGILGYLNPAIYLQALVDDFKLLTNPKDLLAALPLVGYLGLEGTTGVPGEAPGSLFGTFPADPSTSGGGLLSNLDLSHLFGDPSTSGGGLLSNLDLSHLFGDPSSSANMATNVMAGLAGDPSAIVQELEALLSSATHDFSSMLGTDLGTSLASFDPLSLMP